MIHPRSDLRASPAAPLAIALLLGSVAPAHAIPSPELIVGSLSGLSQLGALVAALLGGGGAMALRRRKAGNQGAASRWLVPCALALASVLAVLNVWQWLSARQERTARLEATLVRPMKQPGQPLRDPTLKELGFKEQLGHRLGMSTAEAQTIIAAGSQSGWTLLDIRETAEVETGSFDGATAVRYADLEASGLDLAGKKTLLICHNGNRSSETCQKLAERGIDCRFIVGGLEKWIVEGRSVGGFYRRSLREVRALPAFPNDTTLLDTDDTRRLVEQEGAQIVDVRYPGEFAAGHLPDAVNLPLRSMRTAEIAAAVAALPKRPIVVPCYDRRSCFFGQVFGLAAHRAGHDFRGRYTLPWEFFVANPPPPHIAAFLEAEGRGLWDRAAETLGRALDRGAASLGLLPVLLLLALASRLLVLPFALKAERDQLVGQRIAPEIAALKARLADDPARLARALKGLYARHGLTPLRNQIALLLLPVLMLSLEAIEQVARRGKSALVGTVEALHGAPMGVLPAVFAGLLGLYLGWALARRRWHTWAIWLLAVPALATLTLHLSTAAGVYLAASAALLLAQRSIVTGALGRGARRIQRLFARRIDPLMPRLSEVADDADVGNKARRLGLLMRAGVHVPDGVVLPSAVLEVWPGASLRQRRRLARRILRRAGGGPLAVRSSASAEDGAAQSFAGVLDSVTDVTRDRLPAAIDQVLASFASARAASYAVAGRPNIVVQRMAPAIWSGVLFTRAPDAAGLALVECVEGAGELLVSGSVTPRAFRFGRRSGECLEAAPAAIDFTPLLAIGRQAEALFGAPQDIEWVWADGRFAIVQSRDITAHDGASAAIESEWRAVLDLVAERSNGGAATAPVFVRDEMTEQLPRPNLLSLSLLEALYGSGGSVDLACRSLGLGYAVEEDGPPLYRTLFGQLYLDVRDSQRRAPRLGRLDTRRLRRLAARIDEDFRTGFLPAFLDEIRLLEALDLDALDEPALKALGARVYRTFVTRSHVEAEAVNILAQFQLDEARAGLEAAGESPTDWLSHRPQTAVETALATAATLPRGEALAHLSRSIGHRAAVDYDLAAPRWSDAPATLTDVLHQQAAARAAPGSRHRLAKPLAELVARALTLEVLKEDAKHHVLRELAVLRRSLSALARRFDLDPHLPSLRIEEVLSVTADTRDDLAALATRRAADARELARAGSLPSSLSLVGLERASAPGLARVAQSGDGKRGTRVAGGTRVVEGTACVADMDDAETGAVPVGFRDGDILVTPMVHPAWLPLVLRTGGIVSETGGWLSHMAIVARERDIPMIVAVHDLGGIHSGMRIRLLGDGRIEVDAAEAQPAAAMVANAAE